MAEAAEDFVSRLKAVFALGRIPNLPTIWSNCLAGWLLGGGGNLDILLRVCSGISLLYLGGTFMNDASDTEFDKQFRPERPIPSGLIRERTVWLFSIAFLCIGSVILSQISSDISKLALLLLCLIILYNATHKFITFSPVLIGLCRMFIYLISAAGGVNGLNGLTLWSALALASYVMGLSWIAKSESNHASLPRYIIIPLFVPIILAIIVNDGEYFARGLLAIIVVVIWILRSVLKLSDFSPQSKVSVVTSLLAGIVLIDLLAVAGIDLHLSKYLVIFPLLFILTLFLQKLFPAT